MQTWHKEIRYENKNPFSESVFTETSIFFELKPPDSPHPTPQSISLAVPAERGILSVLTNFLRNPQKKKSCY